MQALCTSDDHSWPSGLRPFLWTPVIHARWRCLWTAGGSRGVKGVPGATAEEPLRRWHHLILTWRGLNRHRSGGRVLKCVWSVRGRRSWCHCLPRSLPQSPVHPPKRGLLLFLSTRMPLPWLSTEQAFTFPAKSGRGLQRRCTRKKTSCSDNLQVSGRKKSVCGGCGDLSCPVWTDEFHFWECSCPVTALRLKIWNQY